MHLSLLEYRRLKLGRTYGTHLSPKLGYACLKAAGSAVALLENTTISGLAVQWVTDSARKLTAPQRGCERYIRFVVQ